MGDYFTDVYLKRMNLDGKNRQERIKTRKEREFNRLYLEKTEYQANIIKVNDTACSRKCSLQPNKWNESSYISNLLISTNDEPFKTGDILQIIHQIKDFARDNLWLVLFVENNLSKGYQLFKIICLDEILNVTDEYGSTKYSIPVKFINNSSNLVLDSYIHSATQLGYREPAASKLLVTHDFSFLQKGDYFELKNRGWEITGIDNISIDNVAYVSFYERLLNPPESKTSQDILVGEDSNFFLNGR